MATEYPLTELEYATILGLSKEGVRSRRRAGKLDGKFIQKDNQYFYERVRPNQVKTAPKNHSRIRRRGAHSSGSSLQYTNTAFRNHNEVKMLLKLQKRIDPAIIDLVPHAIEKIRQEKEEAKQRSVNRVPRSGVKNYGTGIRQAGSMGFNWKPINAEPEEKKKHKYYW